MSVTGSLFGSGSGGAPDPTGAKRDRSLFLAVFPDAGTATRIAAAVATLRQRHGLRARAIDAERLHVTLHHLGDQAGTPIPLVETVARVAASVAAAPFDIVFDRVRSFDRPGRRPIVLDADPDAHANAGLRRLHQQLLRGLLAAGIDGRTLRAAYTPHLTVMYDDVRIAPEAIGPIRWRVSGFELVESLLGRSTYRRLAHWPPGHADADE